MRVLLDTHVFLWWFVENPQLPSRVRRILDSSGPENPVLVSDISLWEIATLHELGRIELELPLRDWLERATTGPRVKVEAITPAVAARVAQLPSSFHRDPADRNIIATSIVLGARLATLDQRLRASGLVPTVS